MTRERVDAGLERTRAFLARAGTVVPRELGVAAFRESLREARELEGTAPHVALVEDLDADGVRLRRYDPDPTANHRPALIYLHGGAFVRGTLDAADPVCRRIAAVAGCVVLSVDYRLAPEHPFPAALEDAEHTLDWAITGFDRLGIDPGAVMIGGDSAGATIATAVARRNAARIRMQVLLCGLFDLTATIVATGRGATEIDLGREQGTLDWVASLYLQNAAHALDPDASPLLVADHAGSPEAIVVTSELDPFAAQNREYVAALRRDAVPVTSLEFAGLPHAFTNFGGIFPEALAVTDVVAAGIRRVGSREDRPTTGHGRQNERTRTHGEATGLRSDLRGAPPTDRLGPLA